MRNPVVIGPNCVECSGVGGGYSGGIVKINLNEGNKTVFDFNVKNLYTNFYQSPTGIWSAVGNKVFPDYNLFSINQDGVLSFKNAPSYSLPQDSDADNIYKVVVRVVDKWTGKKSVQQLNIEVQDV